ncbi:MAG: 5-amino-6-(D-ribitylamino)uracil--L-tyrosine 4-hydroxyphenyl transferase CofH [Lautropia sp.]
MNIEWLLEADGRTVVSAGGERARALHGSAVSFSRKVFAPLTQLCRDFCGYCTFSRRPRAGTAPYMAPADVVALARAGAAQACTELLFTLGDRPEDRFAVAREWLTGHGFASTVDYLHDRCRAVLASSTLLPHVNAGILSRDQMARLREVSVSMGLMLESTSPRLLAKGGAHYRSPDKDPAVRLRMLEEAGELRIPMTTGILIGIGETRLERLQALVAIANLHRRHGHIQEVIVQNFRGKPNTPMRAHPEPSHADHLWTIAAARLLLPDDVAVQAPPNLVQGEVVDLVGAGANDLGGISPVTIDHVNPEAAWPRIASLAATLETAGYALVPRLPVYPAWVRAAAQWIDPGLHGRTLRAADATGHGRESDWRPGDTRAAQPPLAAVPVRAGEQPAPDVRAAVARASAGERLDVADIVRLFEARGADYRHVVRSADALRASTCGDLVRYVVNRNINYTNICGYKCSFCGFSKRSGGERQVDGPYNLGFEQVAALASEARRRGATEVCMQGGIHPSFDGNTYLGLLDAVKAAEPALHVHAFSPLEVAHGAATLGVPVAEFLAELKRRGLGSLPGTAAEVLDDAVRAIICPDKIDTATWLAVIAAAHEAGIPTTSTIMFGHVDAPVHWARHLLALRDLQARTHGFTEFVPLPFVPMNTPMFKRHASRNGPTWRETVLMYAVSRLVLHPLIPNIQTSWVKLGPAGIAATLGAGVNDLGGVLMSESISRAAGSDWGQEMTAEQLGDIARAAGRRIEERTTLYQPVERPAPLSCPSRLPSSQTERPAHSTTSC